MRAAAAVVGMMLLCGIAQGAEPKTVTNTIGMVLIDIPAGKFMMGEGAVTLTKPFWLGKTEVTQGQFKKVMGTETWLNQDDVQIGEDNPATYVDWNNAATFCQRLTDLERKAGTLPAGESYRLPTDAEWEYACRAGTTTTYSFGDGNDINRWLRSARFPARDLELGQYAWFDGNLGDGEKSTRENYAHAVGLKKPNPWGLHDMHGNVWEWCSDWYGHELSGGTDPVGPNRDVNRVLRGGSWWSYPGFCRSAIRDYDVPSSRNGLLGFRVARSQSAQ